MGGVKPMSDMLGRNHSIWIPAPWGAMLLYGM